LGLEGQPLSLHKATIQQRPHRLNSYSDGKIGRLLQFFSQSCPRLVLDVYLLDISEIEQA
jgi:hypothetical protein